MGNGASAARECTVTKCNFLEDDHELKVYKQLNEEGDVAKNTDTMRAYSSMCGYSFLFDIWDLILDCENYPCNRTDLRALCITILPHEKLFPTYFELLKYHEADHKYPKALAQASIHQLKMCCFKLIYTNIYLRSMDSPRFHEMIQEQRAKDTVDPNLMLTVNSFDYLSVIAKGGFGVVLQVRLKSTGALYAMKIQSKNSLISRYKKDTHRVMNEVAAGTVLDHPYIGEIAGAFHSKTLTMLVSPISTCGDLNRSLKLCPDHRMSADRVVFYTAEIVSALMYLHSHDIMYRDLKPSNVLLNADGHVALTDFGLLTGMLM